MDLVSDPVLVVDPETLAIRAANDRASSVLGIPEESLLEADLERVLATVTDEPPDRTSLESSLAADGETELTVGSADGPDRLELASKVVDTDDAPRCLVVLRDRTKRRSARHRRQRELLQTVTGEAPVCQATITATGLVAWAGGRAFDLAGLDPEVMIGEHYDEVFADAPRAREAISTALESGTVVQRTIELGETAVELWLRPVDEDDEAALVATGMDVTSLKGSKDRIQALAAATREFQYADRDWEVAHTVVEIARDLLGHSTAVLYQYDAEHDRLVPWVHDGLESDAGPAADPEKRRSRPGAETGRSGERPRSEEPHSETDYSSSRRSTREDPDEAETIAPGTWEMSVFEGENPTWVPRYDELENPGAAQWLDGGVLAVPLGDHGLFVVDTPTGDDIDREDRMLVETLGRSARSTLDRIAREKETRERARSLEVILDHAPVVLFALDEDGVFTRSEGRPLEALGLGPGEAVGQSVYELFEDYPHVYEEFERARDGERVEGSYEVADRKFETVYVPVEDERAEAAVVGASVDVTDLNRRDRRIRSFGSTLPDLFDAGDSGELAREVASVAESTFHGEGATVWERDRASGGFRPCAGRLEGTDRRLPPEAFDSDDDRPVRLVDELEVEWTDPGSTLAIPVGDSRGVTVDLAESGPLSDDAQAIDLARAIALSTETVLTSLR